MRTSRRPRSVTRLRYKRRSSLTMEVSQTPLSLSVSSPFSLSQQVTSTTHSFRRTSHLLRKAVGNSRMASLRTQLCATLSRLRGSRNSSMLLLLGFREATGDGSGTNPPRRSSRLSPPQIWILSSVSVRVVFFAVVDQSCQSTRP